MGLRVVPGACAMHPADLKSPVSHPDRSRNVSPDETSTRFLIFPLRIALAPEANKGQAQHFSS